MSEFIADRAGLLCCQDKDAMISSFIKMAEFSISEYDNIHPDTLTQQACNSKMLDCEEMNEIVKFLSIADDSHPWMVMRSAELLNRMER